MFNFCNQNDNNAFVQQNINSSYDFETVQKARKDLVGEIQAIIEYDEHIHTSTNKAAIQIWKDIRDEELVHVGKLMGLLNFLEPYQKQFVEEGIKEFNETISKWCRFASFLF